MNDSNTQNKRIAKLIFASVYPMYVAKVEKKGRTKDELNQVIQWLTGFDNKETPEADRRKGNVRNILPAGFAKPQCIPHHRRDLRVSCGRNRRSAGTAGQVPG